MSATDHDEEEMQDFLSAREMRLKVHRIGNSFGPTSVYPTLCGRTAGPGDMRPGTTRWTEEDDLATCAKCRAALAKARGES